MGINVDNVRVIIHTTIPMSMDQYVQEIDRAARDGNNAHCIIFYSHSDIWSLLIIAACGKEM